MAQSTAGVASGLGVTPVARSGGVRAVAALLSLMLGMRYEVYLNVTVGTIAAVALAPVWVPVLTRFRGALAVVSGILVCLPFGYWLTIQSSVDHTTSQRLLVATSVLAVNLLVGTGALLWARTVLPDALVALWFGIGMLLAVPGAGRLAENPWRFGLSVPVSVILLALAWHSGRRWVEVVVGLALAAVTAASGGRSLFAMLMLAVVMGLWQAQPRVLNIRASRVRTTAMLLAVGGLLYVLGQSLSLEGYLGQSAQMRTEQQVAQSGSVILGGRPELGASLALLGHHPTGFGAGTKLNIEDLMVAKAGMAELGYDPDNGYVERYMFGDGIELHSYLADLWADFGVAGLALGVIILWQVLRHVSGGLAHRRASALIVFLAVQTLWNFLFSPRYGSMTLLVLSVPLMLNAARPDVLAPCGDRLAR